MHRSNPRDSQGSIAITMTIAMIVTALTAAMLTIVFRDLRVTRQAGDSANALQVADAGINEAVKEVGTAAGTVGACSGYPTLAGFTRTNAIAGGTYTYCAAQEVDSLGRTVWHVDSEGVDKSGVKRRLRAEAQAEPMFPNAIQVLASAGFSSGFEVDSYDGEVNRCTKKGKVGTNSPETLSFNNNGVGQGNCQSDTISTWSHPVDGCVAFSRDGDKVIDPADQGNGKCPPSASTSESPEFSAPTPRPPAVYDYPTMGTGPGGNLSCTSATLQAGKTYYYNSVTLGVGCGVSPTGLSFPAMANPVKIFTSNLTISGGNGNSGNNVNEPPNNATVCGPTHGTAGANHHYCPGWPGVLQIEVIGSNDVLISGNHSTFWGTVRAPSSLVRWTSGAPSWEMFGSLIAGSLGGGVQADFHYDEALGAANTGRHFLSQWREEAQK